MKNEEKIAVKIKCQRMRDEIKREKRMGKEDENKINSKKKKKQEMNIKENGEDQAMNIKR